MNALKKLSTAERRFALVAMLIGIGYLLLEWANGRAQMADFRVYYDAADALLHNGKVYGEAFGVSSGFYKYSPFACVPFMPFVFLPYALASVIYYIIVLLGIIWLMIHLVREVTSGTSGHSGWILALTTLFMADHLERELHLGNINLFLLIACFVIYRSIVAQREIQAGLIYGLVLLFKPHFLILLPYWLWRKKWKLTVSALLAICLGLLLPALFKGWNTNLELLQSWMTAIRDHNVQLYDSPNTLYGLINTLLPDTFPNALLVPLMLAIAGIGFLILMIRNGKSLTEEILYLEMFVLIGLIPNLTHTDTEHFMWTWPLIALAISSLFHITFKNKWIAIVLLALAFIPYCVNSPDIVGKSVRYLFDEGGLLGLANLIIILVSIFIFRRKMQVN